MLCCPRGYCFQVHSYQGKDEKRPADQTLAEYAVKSVMLSKFYQAGHLLAIDSKERGASKALRRIQGKHAVYTYAWIDNKPVLIWYPHS
jgi:hypothetical protein